MAARIRVKAAADAREWTLYLLIPAMPADFIKVGDAFDMHIDAKRQGGVTANPTTDQTLVLARAGKAIVFATDMQVMSGGPPLPDLLPFGIAVSDAGTTCETTSGSCDGRSHALRVSVATDASIVLAAGQTGAIGGLSITNAGLNEFLHNRPNCDRKSSTRFAGFRLP
jgi:hypothetical protein